MAQAFIAAMPPDLDLDVGCQIVFEAVDPATGDPVPDVTIGAALIRVDTNITGGDGGGGGILSSGPFMLVPGPDG